MAENQFVSTVEALFKGMDQFVTTKTVVGDAVKVDDAIILPLVDVTCGMAAGSFADNIEVEYVTDQPTYENLWKTSHSASVAFTCGGQRVTYTFDTASRKRIVSDIETL